MTTNIGFTSPNSVDCTKEPRGNLQASERSAALRLSLEDVWFGRVPTLSTNAWGRHHQELVQEIGEVQVNSGDDQVVVSKICHGPLSWWFLMFVMCVGRVSLVCTNCQHPNHPQKQMSLYIYIYINGTTM